MRTKDIVLLIVIALSTALQSHGGGKTINTYLKTDGLAKGAVLKLSDPQVYHPVNGYNKNWKKNIKLKQTTNAVELFLNTDAAEFGQQEFSVTLDLKLSYKDAQNKVVQNNKGKDTTRFQLDVNYNRSGDYKLRDIHVFENAHKIYVEVNDVTIQGADTASLTNVVFLRSSITMERYQKMKHGKVKRLRHRYDKKDNELEISWKDKKGAVWYDVEWSFVENYGYNQGNMQRKSQSDLYYNFEKNSQRIRTKDHKYRIPVVYNEGYLVYRVRPVTVGGSHLDKKKFGLWSIIPRDKVSQAGNNVFTVTSSIVQARDKMNWQYQATYTERGSKRALVHYYDGLNYKRQTVKRIQTEDNVLINEHMYDYHGRKALDVLPAPRAVKNPHPNLKYYDAFNKNQQGNPYNKSNFDDLAGCSPAADPMNNSSGAAKYYSSNNQSQNQFKNHLPKSEGYPFKQTQYMPDRSGDVSSMGKPGKQYQIGKGHAVQKFNGTVWQSELDRLFGSEVGNAGNYRKRIIANENGQLRVQYLNERGDPIASALAGGSPKALEKLPSDQVKSMTMKDNILDSRQRVRQNSLEASSQFVVATEGKQYSFKYTVNPSTFNRNVCDGESICYDGIYNLRIRLTNECGDVIKDTSKQIGSVKNIDEKCNDNKSVTLSFNSGPLSIGSYTLTKRLEINEQALQEYLDLFAGKSCIQAHYDTIYNENREKMDTLTCNAGCGSSDVVKRKYEYTTEDGETREDKLSDAEYKRMKERRQNLCGGGANTCQSMLDVLRGDISPGGQYALFYDSVDQEVNPHKFKLSVLNDSSNALPGKKAHWRNPASPYEDRQGNINYVNISRIGGISGVLDTSKMLIAGKDTLIQPENILKVSDFIDVWKDSWAEALLPYHPEYGYYLWCSQHPASNNYDSHLLGTGKYRKAVDSGYITSGGATKLLSNDPFFQNHPTLKQKMQDTLNTFVSDKGESFSLEEMVIAMHNGCAPVKCGTGSMNFSKMQKCINNHKPLFKNKDEETRREEWSSYRSIYLALKRKIIAPERHKFAIKNGYYNGCIGSKGDNYFMRRIQFRKNYPNASKSFNIAGSCLSCTDCYSEKDIRFSGEDDIYKYIDGLEKATDSAEVDQMENYVDNRMKNQCDKCPIENDLEVLLNGMVRGGSLTKNQDATAAVASCDIKDQMNASNLGRFSWKASVSGRELTGKLMSNNVQVATIKLYDSTKRQLNWNNVVLLTCLQHTTTTNHYNNTQKRNFKLRAITKDNEVFWLEGITNNIDLTDCDIEKFCTKNSIAGELQSLFDIVFGTAPLAREYYIDMGYKQQVDSLMPAYQNTRLVGEMNIRSLPQQLISQHKYPRSFAYYWKVDDLKANGQKLVAGIYEAKKINKCPFEFEILDDSKQFGKPFMVNKILLNHPAIDQTSCEATAFVLEVRQLKTGNSQNLLLQSGQGQSPGWDLSEPFYIKVTNQCYSAGECCPESNCPDIAKNGGFGKGTSDFSSDLPYDKQGKKDNYYKVFPSSGNNTGGFINNIPVEELFNTNLVNVNNLNTDMFNMGDTSDQGGNQGNIYDMIGSGTLDNFTGLTDTTGGEGAPNPQFSGMLDMTNLQDFDADSSNRSLMLMQQMMQQSRDMYHFLGQLQQTMQDMQQSVMSNIRGDSGGDKGSFPYWKKESDTTWTTFPGYKGQQQTMSFTKGQFDQLRDKVVMGSFKTYINSYLVFKVSDKTEREVWKQNLDFKKDRTYSFSVKVKKLVKNIPRAEGQFSLIVGNQKNTLSFKDMSGKWKVFTAYFDVSNASTSDIALQFEPELQNPNVGYQKWAVDDIVVKPQSCEKPGCCPPITPSVPDDAFENPCKAKKDMIAEANSEREFERFLEDTLTGIESAYRNAVMAVDESFTVSRTNNYYDYTLYYYDQSGNLVRTVPPNGFNPLSKSKVRQVQQNRKNNSNNPVYPNHSQQTTYQYNSYDELVYRKSPDEGAKRFWYDELGRVVAEQTASQASQGSEYTYYLYDALNRKIEAGQVNAGTKLDASTARNYTQFEQWVKRGTRWQVVHKYFDKSMSSAVNGYFPDGQNNLRKRVASVVYEEKWDRDKSTYDFATHFSYDAHGNVDYLVKENTEFPQPHQVKKVDYEFDVISGDISRITYQPGSKDQFIHEYKYDEDNRLSKVLTSKYGVKWEEEAKYYYYPHGKIARVELGEEKVQGLDYAYTLQGWLKGINGSELEPENDAGKDGSDKGPYQTVARDALSLVLDYNDGDYKSAGSRNLFSSHLNGPLQNSSANLYSADVRQMVVNNAAFDDRKGLALAYKYDQNMRLVQTESYYQSNNTWQSTGDYETSYSYDPNGNITKLTREGDNGPMDRLSYNYQKGNNRIDYISDQVGDGSYPDDIDDQKKSNYRYDAQGRLTQDLAAGIQNVDWSRHDKVKSVVKRGYGSVYNYYDGTGFRIMKDYIVSDNSKSKVVSYVRGVTNEILAKYTYKPSEDSTYLSEHYIHGRSRLGVYQQDTTMNAVSQTKVGYYRGNKHYEIGNHLDNVLATVSDRKLVDTTAAPTANKYRPDIVSATGYYPYGSQLPGRNESTGIFGHGFQGREKDDELKGEGNSYYFKERMYDPRLGRWLSVDPKAKKFPGQSPYIGMAANPVSRIDNKGGEDHPACSVDWQIALSNDRELQKGKQDGIVSKATYGDAYAINTGEAIFAYKTIEKSDVNKLSRMSPAFRYSENNEVYKNLPSKKIRVKTVSVKTEDGEIKTKQQASVYKPSNQEGGKGSWIPIRATAKGQQVMADRSVWEFYNQKGIWQGDFNATPQEHARKEFRDNVKFGNAMLTNPGASIGVFAAAIKGNDMEGMKRDMRLGASVWSIMGASIGTVHKVHRGNITSGPAATQRQGGIKSERGKGVK